MVSPSTILFADYLFCSVEYGPYLKISSRFESSITEPLDLHKIQRSGRVRKRERKEQFFFVSRLCVLTLLTKNKLLGGKEK